MSDEEYAIVSKKEFLALKKELDKLKKDPLGDSEQGENLQGSIDNLSKSLNVMLEVFKQAAQDMSLEDHDNALVGKQMGPLNEKLDTLIEQNQKIAKGIVAVADMVKEKLDELKESRPESKPALPPLSGAPKPPMSGPMSPPMGGPMSPPMGVPMPPPPMGGPMPPGQGNSFPPGPSPPMGADLLPPSNFPPPPPPGNLPPPGQNRVMGGLMK